MNITTKQRAYLRSQAMTLPVLIQIGKNGLTPETIVQTRETLEKHELLKANVQKNSPEEINECARILAERTGSVLVQVLGRKITIYKRAEKEKNRKIVLPQ